MGDRWLSNLQAVLDVGGAHTVGLIDGAVPAQGEHAKNLAAMRIGDGTQPDAELVVRNLGH